MSEALSDQPVAADAPVAEAPAGVAAEPTQASDDISTEAFDRVEAPDDDADGAAAGGDLDAPVVEDKPQPAAAADTVEIDLGDGLKITVPKSAEQAFLRQSDYTQKTQALAEQRKAFETEQTQQLESLKEFRAEHLAIDQREAALTKIDADLGEYRKLTQADWQAIKAQDPAAYQTHVDNYEELRRGRVMAEDALTAAKTALTSKEASLTERLTAAETAKLNDAWGKANAEIAKDIPDWGPEKFQEIGKFAMKEFGVTAEQLQQTADPTAWKMTSRLMKSEAENATLRAQLKQQTAATTTAKTLEATPAAKPAGASAGPRGVVDSLSDDEWFRRRKLQKARKAS